MALAIALARLVEVEFRADVERPKPALAVGAQDPAKPKVTMVDAAPEPESRPAPSSPERTHVVKDGETLGMISKRYYRTTTHWKVIYEANRDKIRNPRSMRPGTRIRIPRLSK